MTATTPIELKRRLLAATREAPINPDGPAAFSYIVKLEHERDELIRQLARPADPTPQQTREEQANALRQVRGGDIWKWSEIGKHNQESWLAVRDEAARMFGDGAREGLSGWEIWTGVRWVPLNENNVLIRRTTPPEAP